MRVATFTKKKKKILVIFINERKNRTRIIYWNPEIVGGYAQQKIYYIIFMSSILIRTKMLPCIFFGFKKSISNFEVKKSYLEVQNHNTAVSRKY